MRHPTRRPTAGATAAEDTAPAALPAPPSCRPPRRCLPAAPLVALVWLIGVLAAATSVPAAGPGARAWRDAAGTPLPFASDAAACAWLAAAREVSREEIPVGVTHPVKVRLEHGGVEAHACFRHHHETGFNKRLEGRRVLQFRDSHRNEVAAYRLSRLLGLDWIPPTVPRRLHGREGSLQLWVEGATTLAGWREDHEDENVLAGSPRLADQLQDMRVFDNLINNIDRNAGNLLLLPAPDGDHDLILIDHTRSFGRERELPSPDRVGRCSRRLYDALRALDRRPVVATLAPLVGRPEARAVMARRDLLVELIDERVELLGEEAVLMP